MADVKSYAWSEQLAADVPSGEHVDVETPGFENPDNYDTTKTEVVVGANVLRQDQVSATWDADFSKVTLKNTDENLTWGAATTVSVTVPGIPFDTENVEESFHALSAKVDDHETRIAALESAVLGSKAPQAHPAKAQEPPKAAQSPPKAAPAPVAPRPGAPQHRGKA